MTGRGRPAIGQVAKARLHPEQLEAVDEFAKAFEVPRAVALRMLVSYGLDFHPQPGEPIRRGRNYTGWSARDHRNPND